MRISVVSVSVLAAFVIAGAGWSYTAGILRRADVGRPVSSYRHWCFGSGLVLLLLSVEPPFEAWTREYYSLHQLGILVARTLAPMLIAGARPAGLLVAGLPHRLRARALKPALLAPRRRAVWHALAMP